MIPQKNSQRQIDVNLWLLGTITTPELKERMQISQTNFYYAYRSDLVPQDSFELPTFSDAYA